MGERKTRTFAVLGGLAVVLAGLTAVGLSRPETVAAKTCATADLSLTQAISAGPVDTVTIVNLGPCNASGLTVVITPSNGQLPALSQVTVNPGSMRCSETATSLVCTTTSQVSASPSDTQAGATISFPAQVGVEYDSRTNLNDPNQTEGGGHLSYNNNESWLTPLDPAKGGSVNAGNSNQLAQVNVPFVSGGQNPAAQIQLASFACPKGYTPCLGFVVHTTNPTTTTGTPSTVVLSYLASTLPNPSQPPTLYWSDNPPAVPFAAVGTCTGPGATPDPCIASAGFVTIGGQSYYQFVVNSSFDNWWF